MYTVTGHEKIVRLLVEVGAGPNLHNQHDNTAKDLATGKGDSISTIYLSYNQI